MSSLLCLPSTCTIKRGEKIQVIGSRRINQVDYQVPWVCGDGGALS